MTDNKYRADIDGLRGVAISMVVLFHCGFGLPGGFIGVDVFFVISGYLITRLIWVAQQQQTFSIAEFWIRRLRRLIPASALVTAVVFASSALVLLPNDFCELAKSLLAQQLMVSNVYFWRSDGYFAVESDFKPLLHTWSLAVEEQFYLVYPLLLASVTRYKPKLTYSILIIGAIASFCLNVYGARYHPSATFYLLPTRAWELLIGGVVFLFPRNTNSTALTRELWSVSGLIGIVISAFSFGPETPFPGLAAALPCCSAACFIRANERQDTLSGRLIAARPMVFIGLISYSLYLWHWPILVLARHLAAEVFLCELSHTGRFSCLIISFIASVATWRYIEVPFREKKGLATSTRLLGATVSASLFFVLTSMCVVITKGVPQRFSPQVLRYMSAREAKAYDVVVDMQAAKRGEFPVFGDHDATNKCIVWGDSHAMSLMAGIDGAAKAERVKLLLASRYATAPLIGYIHDSPSVQGFSGAFAQEVVAHAVSEKVDSVIMAARWQSYSKSPLFLSSLASTVQTLSASGIRVAVVLDVAEQPVDVPLALAGAIRCGRDISTIGTPMSVHRAKSSYINSSIRLYVGHNAVVLDPAPFFLNSEDLWSIERDGESLYIDRHHLSDHGGRLTQLLFRDFFKSTMTTRPARRIN